MFNQVGDDQYIKKSYFEENFLGIDQNKKQRMQAYIDNECVDNIDNSVSDDNCILEENILLQDQIPLVIIQSHNVYDMSCKYYKDTLADI